MIDKISKRIIEEGELFLTKKDDIGKISEEKLEFLYSRYHTWKRVAEHLQLNFDRRTYEKLCELWDKELKKDKLNR